MTSMKQKRAVLKTRRRAKRQDEIPVKLQKRAAADAKEHARQMRDDLASGAVAVDPVHVMPHKSAAEPDFITRGTYRDLPFQCQGCGKAEVWTAAQQKWWYEFAKGYRLTTATLCRPCRRKERDRKNEARRVHLEGVARKRAKPK